MSVDSTTQIALIKTSELLGSDLYDTGGHKIATIREIFVDPVAGQAHFAIVEIAALLGSGGKYHPVPWSVLRYDPGRGGYVAPFDRDRLKAGPAYDRDQINSNAYGWDTTVRSFYGA